MLDPCYGVYHPTIAKWLNRFILITEIGVIVQAVRIFIDMDRVFFWEWYHYTLFSLAAILFMPLANLIIRKVWDILMVIIYGTTDADEIIRAHEERIQRKRDKNLSWTMDDNFLNKLNTSGKTLEEEKKILEKTIR